MTVLLAFWFASLVPSYAREPQSSAPPFPPPVVTTNYVLVTNVVLITVTNYVVSTNLVLTTNGVTAAQSKPKLPDLNWVPPEDGYDWIQLKSGEWLKGRFKGMQRRKLEFDSEELELLSFDWKDIRQVRSLRIQDVLFDNRETVSGPISVTPDQVTIGNMEKQTFRREDLESITPGGSKERNFWSGKLAMGLTFHSGNTKELDYNAQASVERRTPNTRLDLGYIGNLSRVDNTENSNNHRVNGEFDYFLTSRLYVMTPIVEYFRDPFQNISHRLTAGVGVGYDLVYQPNIEWTIFAGPAYQNTWFRSVERGEPSEAQAAAGVFGSKLDWELTRRVELTLEYRGQYTSRTVDQFSQHAAAILEFKMTKRFDLDLSFFWDRTGNPTAEKNGDVPQSDDIRVVGGLGVRF